MPDMLMMTGWFAHMGLLIALAAYGAKRLQWPKHLWPFFAFVMVWADLVLTGHLASIFHTLNSLTFYFPATFFVMAGLFALVQAVQGKTAPLQTAPIKLDFASFSPQTRRNLWLFCGITFALLLAANLFTVISSYPDNADSIIYRLPRVIWYVSSGSFMHPFDALDKRLTFYPLDGVALYVPMALYAVPGVFYNFPSPIMWLAVGYTAYRFARELGADRLIASFAAWLVISTPNILAQAVSTNDEILAAAALLVGLYMGFVWLRTGERSFLFLMATAVGLSVGTKMHIIFLTPVILIAIALALYEAFKKQGTLSLWGQAIGWKTGLISSAMLCVMVLPFFLYNFLSTGDFYFLQQSANEVLNINGSIHAFFQNLLIYTSQMVFSPIGDLNMSPDATARQSFDNVINNLTNPFILPLLSQDASLYHANYRFHGVTIATSIRYVEFSLWAGFVWLLWPLQIMQAARYKNAFPLRNLFLLFAATPLLWLLMWSATTLYMEGTATYFSYYLTVAAPAAALGLLAIKNAKWNRVRWRLIGFVVVTNIMIVTNIYAYSGFRSIHDIVLTDRWPFDWLMFDASVKEEVRLASRIRILFTHEKMPYFAFMRWNPRASYLDPHRPPAAGNDDVLQIIPASGINSFGFMPIKIKGKATPGATYIGLIRGIGREAIFAVGNNVEKRHPEESDYILPQLIAQPSMDGYAVGFLDSMPAGFNSKDDLEFRFEITAGTKLVYEHDWDPSPRFYAVLNNNPNEYQHILTIHVRSMTTHKELATQPYQLLGPGQWLPDGPDY